MKFILLHIKLFYFNTITIVYNYDYKVKILNKIKLLKYLMIGNILFVIINK